MSAALGRFHFLTPAYRAAGGIVKVFDYLVHALELGYEVDVHCPHELAAEEPLLRIPRFTRLRDDPRVRFHRELTVGVGPDDWVLFSWPPHYEQIARGISPETPHERVIHLVQGTRHANPAFADGYAVRLLARPLARIMVSPEVMRACAPYLNRESSSRTIVEGHNWEFFYRNRDPGLPRPIHVGYTTWKSEVGEKVQRVLRERDTERQFEFRSLEGRVSWKQVRELLHWSDVFLCCPGPEEGFYLSGLEALAAGAIVITPDVGGNRAYCRFGQNCLLVGYEDAEGYAAALERLWDLPPTSVDALRSQGYATLQDHTLTREGAEFAKFLIDVSARCRVRALGL